MSFAPRSTVVLTINDSKSDKVAGKIDVFFRQSSIFVGEVGMRLCLLDINFRHPSNTLRILAYFDQIRGSGGYTVEFASMSQINNSVQAVVKQTDSDGNDIEIMTQPYSIVIIDKTENKVEFIKQ